MVGVLAFELDHVIRGCYLALAHRAAILLRLSLSVRQYFYFFLGEAFGNLPDLFSEFDELLSGGGVTS